MTLLDIDSTLVTDRDCCLFQKRIDYYRAYNTALIYELEDRTILYAQAYNLWPRCERLSFIDTNI